MDPHLPFAAVVGLVIAGLFVIVLWLLLPFAVFGVKPLLRQLLEEQRAGNETLRAIRDKRP